MSFQPSGNLAVRAFRRMAALLRFPLSQATRQSRVADLASAADDGDDIKKAIDRSRAARLGGEAGRAAAELRRLYPRAPNNPALLQELGLAAAEFGDISVGLGALVQALALDPTLVEAGRTLAWMLQSNQLTEDSPAISRVLQAMLDRDDLASQSFARSALNLIGRRPAIQRALALVGLPAEADAWAAMPVEAMWDPLLLRILERTINRDPALERLLTRLRRDFLVRDVELGAPQLRFAAALAQQARNNEFVFTELADERTALAAASSRMAQRDLRDLLRVAMYQPVARLLPPDFRLPPDCPEAVRRLVATAISEEREEARLRGTIASLNPVNDATSLQVKQHYEENPYPRWFRLTVPLAGSRLEITRQMLPADSGKPLRVLIAGGGTGWQSIAAALGYGPDAEVLAIDLSIASLAYSARKAKEYGVGNLRHLCCDLLDVGLLAEEFDVIECTGVLVCVADPAEALRRLAAKLRPGGLMYLALYSEIARWDVVSARALISQRGYSDSPDDMRRFRQDIMQAPASTVGRELLRSPGFYSLSTCRDFLFHKVEHRFTLEQVEKLLADCGLAFRAWNLPVGVQAQFDREFGASAAGNFAQWAAFERAHPATFRGMYQFWCQKPATAASPDTVPVLRQGAEMAVGLQL